MDYNKDTFTGPSFSLRNRILRFIWGFVNSIFFKLSPRSFHIWRVFLLRCFGAKIGKGVHIYSKVKIWAPWNLEIGNNVGIANGVYLYSQNKIKVGHRTIISENAYISTGTHDYNDPGNKLITKPITIEEDCWLAVGVFVHPGIRIPKGVIVGACSVVVKNPLEWSIYAGNPCQKLKNRNKRNESN